jgi:predicted Zn-dependent protease
MLKSLHGLKKIMYQKIKLKKLLQQAMLKPSLKLMTTKNIHTDSYKKNSLLFLVMNLKELIHQHGHLYGPRKMN